MRGRVLLASIVVLAPQLADARIVRHSSIPQAYWGTWMPAGTCTSADKAPAIVLAAKSYRSAAVTCDVEYVSETPGARAPIFSAHLLCADTDAPGRKKSVTDVIIRSDEGDQISLGSAFESLTGYQRCGASGVDSDHK